MEIRLTGISATGYHGVLPSERENGQTFVVDLSVFIESPEKDDIANTVNYAELAELVVQIITGEPVQLIETLAERILTACLAKLPDDGMVQVSVHKPQAPIPVPFDDVVVTMVRPKNE